MALTDNLVAYWKFDESSGNATDATGNGNTGTNSSVAYSTGKINNAADFTRATPSYFTLSSSGTSMSFSGDFTLMAWVKLASSGGGSLLTKATGNGGSSNNYEFLVFNSAIQLAGNVGKYSSASATLTAGTWYHVCVVKTSTSTVTTYLNGSSLTTTYPAGSPIFGTNSTQPYIGRRDDGAGNGYFSGSIDELGAWNRALTGAEISTIYNSGSGLAYPFGVATNTTNFFQFF